MQLCVALGLGLVRPPVGVFTRLEVVEKRLQKDENSDSAGSTQKQKKVKAECTNDKGKNSFDLFNPSLGHFMTF